ncbi:hypothetical protein EON65_10970 [archaeon]|nr:MAG: hypothetical protein EON65_10970 [archaeon]
MTDQKIDRLQAAFLKALDASINSIGESELNECFADLKQQLGGNIQMAFVNMISRSEKRVEAEYASLTDPILLSHYLDNLEGVSERAAVSRSEESERLMTETIKAVKKAELEEINNAIKVLEHDIKKSNDIVGRLRTQLYNEIEALNEQGAKLQRVSEHCT